MKTRLEMVLQVLKPREMTQSMKKIGNKRPELRPGEIRKYYLGLEECPEAGNGEYLLSSQSRGGRKNTSRSTYIIIQIPLLGQMR